MPGRKFTSNLYRYGFNGKEKDDEINSIEGAYDDFGARMYDSRLGRWMSVDPLAYQFSSHSPYNYCLNNPIVMSDPDGEKPKVTIVENADGTVSITVTNSLYVVANNAGEKKAIMNALGDPTDFYGGQSVNTTVVINGEARAATMTFVTEIKDFKDTKNASIARNDAGFGTIVTYDSKVGSSSFNKNTPELGDYLILAPKSSTWKGDAAHELAHDWAGLTDTYVVVDGAHCMVVDGNDQIVRELMNDGNSPLSEQQITRLAQEAVNKNLKTTGKVAGEFTGSILDIDQEAKNKVGQTFDVARVVKDSHGADANKLIIRQASPSNKSIFQVTVGEGNKGSKTGKSRSAPKTGHMNVRFL